MGESNLGEAQSEVDRVYGHDDGIARRLRFFTIAPALSPHRRRRRFAHRPASALGRLRNQPKDFNRAPPRSPRAATDLQVPAGGQARRQSVAWHCAPRGLCSRPTCGSSRSVVGASRACQPAPKASTLYSLSVCGWRRSPPSGALAGRRAFTVTQCHESKEGELQSASIQTARIQNAGIKKAGIQGGGIQSAGISTRRKSKRMKSKRTIPKSTTSLLGN